MANGTVKIQCIFYLELLISQHIKSTDNFENREYAFFLGFKWKIYIVYCSEL